MTKLSVITICYNDKAGLEKTMASVTGQTFSDFEYIVIDGGSTDDSVEVIRKYAALGKVAYWVSQKDNGIYDAQNKGWRRATGDYCLFLNSGDFLANENVLAEIFAWAPTEDIVYGDLMVDNGKIAPYRLGQPAPFTFDDLIYSTVFHPTAFIRRSLLEEAGGYDESFRIVADYDFFLRALLVRKCSSKYVPVAVTVFNTSGVGSDPANQTLHNEERYRAQLKYFSPDEIAAAERRVRKRKPRAVRLKESTSNIPVLGGLVDFALVMYNRIRKTGK